MSSQSRLARVSTHHQSELVELPAARTEHYGGMVGELLDHIETRMSVFPRQQASPPVLHPVADPVHMVSVASGYVGLALGVVGAAWLISLAF